MTDCFDQNEDASMIGRGSFLPADLLVLAESWLNEPPREKAHPPPTSAGTKRFCPLLPTAMAFVS